jgi:hypothetical protein
MVWHGNTYIIACTEAGSKRPLYIKASDSDYRKYLDNGADLLAYLAIL